jgi:hypothetical protein
MKRAARDSQLRRRSRLRGEGAVKR